MQLQFIAFLSFFFFALHSHLKQAEDTATPFSRMKGAKGKMGGRMSEKVSERQRKRERQKERERLALE